MLWNRQVHEARQINRRAKPHKMTDKAIKGRFDERLDFDDWEPIVEFPLLFRVIRSVRRSCSPVRIFLHLMSKLHDRPWQRIYG